MADDETKTDEQPTDTTDEVQIVIRYNTKTSALQCDGAIPQPVIFYGILEAAKEWMRYMMAKQQREAQANAQMRASIMGGGKPLPPEFRRGGRNGPT